MSKIISTYHCGSPLLELSGELKSAECLPLWRALRQAMEATPSPLHVDLRKVGQMDPSCALLLVTTRRFLKRRGRTLQLLGAPEPVDESLRVAEQRLRAAS